MVEESDPEVVAIAIANSFEQQHTLEYYGEKDALMFRKSDTTVMRAKVREFLEKRKMVMASAGPLFGKFPPGTFENFGPCPQWGQALKGTRAPESVATARVHHTRDVASVAMKTVALWGAPLLQNHSHLCALGIN